MYTKCPDCSSVFQLSPEVLGAAGGMVRCGVCDSTFNALRRLTEAPPDETEAAPTIEDDVVAQDADTSPTSEMPADSASVEPDRAPDAMDATDERPPETATQEPRTAEATGSHTTVANSEPDDTAQEEPFDSPGQVDLVDRVSALESLEGSDSELEESDSTEELFSTSQALDEWDIEEGEQDLEALLADDALLEAPDEAPSADLFADEDAAIEHDASGASHDDPPTSGDIEAETEADTDADADADANDDALSVGAAQSPSDDRTGSEPEGSDTADDESSDAVGALDDADDQTTANTQDKNASSQGDEQRPNNADDDAAAAAHDSDVDDGETPDAAEAPESDVDPNSRTIASDDEQSQADAPQTVTTTQDEFVDDHEVPTNDGDAPSDAHDDVLAQESSEHDEAQNDDASDDTTQSKSSVSSDHDEDDAIVEEAEQHGADDEHGDKEDTLEDANEEAPEDRSGADDRDAIAEEAEIRDASNEDAEDDSEATNDAGAEDDSDASNDADAEDADTDAPGDGVEDDGIEDDGSLEELAAARADQESAEDADVSSAELLTAGVDGQFDDRYDDEDLKDLGHYLKPGKSLARRLGESMLALLLVAALGVQYIHYNREELATHPQHGPRVQAMYAALGLELQANWKHSDYRVARHLVEPDADNAEVLRALVTLVNDTPHSRPLPLVRLKLNNRWGDAIYGRVFTPDEYLSGTALDNLAGNARLDVRLDLVHPSPGEDIGYVFDLCLSTPRGPDCGVPQTFSP